MKIVNSFESFLTEAQKFPHVADWTSKQRSKELLDQSGLPTRKQESWRNTSLNFLNENYFKPATHSPTQLPDSVLSLASAKMIEGCDALVFLNGFYMPGLSRFDMATVFVSENTKKPVFFQGDADSASIHHLNELYNLNPIDITIKSDLNQPLQILNLTHLMGGESLVTSPKVNVTVKSNIEAKIVLSQVGEHQARYFTNAQYTFAVQKDARLELVNDVNQSVNAFHFDFVGIAAESSSTVRYFEINLNAQLTRHELVLELNGEHIQSEILGASYLKDNQHCDSQTYINHHKGSCQSEQVYKALLDDESRSVFSGTVFIAEGVAKTDSAQLNQNLLLSDRVEVNSKPILRIYSDDVKASHGSTTGKIQEDEIFYLQSRSISRSKAIELLGQGFLNAIVLRMGSEVLKKYFSKELLNELGTQRETKLKVVK
jgi:Fe-S cluster assembly protein SufD